MTDAKFRTTKLPTEYFDKMESYVELHPEYVSVSNLQRKIIDDFFQRENEQFLTKFKIIFNENVIKLIHTKISNNFDMESKEMLKENTIRKIINDSFDIDKNTFLSKFLVTFAKVHPFDDGNKRTSWLTVDIFLRLIGQTLEINTDKNITEDEKFIWQNSANQKTVEQVKEYLANHIKPFTSSISSIEDEIDVLLKEKKSLWTNLSE
ncbi:MAG: Fic family protein [Candidatus Woesearchaeota archaeon]|jgi:prophage maintenance system killer protein